ncbi:MAG: lysophospholipid acyltransferase family protein [Thermodesulfobacteriota bacterium]
MKSRPEYSRWESFKYSLAARLGAWLLRALFRTCQTKILREDLVQKYFGGGRGAIGVTWHRGAIFFLHFFAPQRPAIMISRSRDGEYLARYLRAMGGVPVRGSSSRGGAAALKEMAAYLAAPGRYAATVADGPRGPRHQAKAGMITLAMMTGLPLIPLMWSAKRVWVLGRTWDRTMIPKPFARVLIDAGPELSYPPEMTPAQREQARLELQQALERLRQNLDALTGFQDSA